MLALTVVHFASPSGAAMAFRKALFVQAGLHCPCRGLLSPGRESGREPWVSGPCWRGGVEHSFRRPRHVAWSVCRPACCSCIETKVVQHGTVDAGSLMKRLPNSSSDTARHQDKRVEKTIASKKLLEISYVAYLPRRSREEVSVCLYVLSWSSDVLADALQLL